MCPAFGLSPPKCPPRVEHLDARAPRSPASHSLPCSSIGNHDAGLSALFLLHLLLNSIILRATIPSLVRSESSVCVVPAVRLPCPPELPSVLALARRRLLESMSIALHRPRQLFFAAAGGRLRPPEPPSPRRTGRTTAGVRTPWTPQRETVRGTAAEGGTGDGGRGTTSATAVVRLQPL